MIFISTMTNFEHVIIYIIILLRKYYVSSCRYINYRQLKWTKVCAMYEVLSLLYTILLCVCIRLRSFWVHIEVPSEFESCIVGGDVFNKICPCQCLNSKSEAISALVKIEVVATTDPHDKNFTNHDKTLYVLKFEIPNSPIISSTLFIFNV